MTSARRRKYSGFSTAERPVFRSRSRGKTDELVRRSVVVIGLLSAAIGLVFHHYATPFPWLGAILLFFLAAASRV